MKRFFRIFAVAALACATFVACENKFDDYDPAQQVEGAQVYFPKENTTSVSVSKADDKPITITVMRGLSEAAVSVPVTLTQGEEGAFTAPAKVDFKAGMNKTSIDVTYDMAKLKEGSSYKITLTIGDQSATTPYGNNEITVTVKVPEPFVLLGKGLYRDDFVPNIFDIGGNPEYEVEIYENTNNPGFIYLKNPYGAGYPVKASNFKAFENDVYFAIDVRNPEAVVIPEQAIGLTVDPYGDIWVRMSGDNVGTYADGVITFGPKTMEQALTLYQGGSFDYFWGCENGLTRIVMPGVVLTDYELKLAYGGFRVAGDDETTYPIARVAFGVDVAQIQYAFVEGDITADAAAIQATLAGMADGTIESTTVDAVDDTGEEMPEEDSEEEEVEQVYAMDLVSPDALGSGIYTVIALPINAEGEVITNDGDLLSFYNPGVGEAAVPEVDLAAYAMTLEELETYDESLEGMAAYYAANGYNSTNCFGFLVEGSEIAELKVLPATTASIGDILANGFTLEEYVLTVDAQLQDLDMDTKYINADGWDYNIFGAKADTSYTCLIYAKNAYGKEAMFYASHTTDAADATAKRKVVLHKLDGVTLNKSFKNIEIH